MLTPNTSISPINQGLRVVNKHIIKGNFAQNTIVWFTSYITVHRMGAEQAVVISQAEVK